MFKVNDIPPIDGWELQQLIAENVQHEEFLFSGFTPGMSRITLGRTATPSGMNASARPAGSGLPSRIPPDRPANGGYARAAAGISMLRAGRQTTGARHWRAARSRSTFFSADSAVRSG